VTIKRSGPGFASLQTHLKALNGVEAKAGVFETAHYADGTPVAYVLAIQEFGAGPIPPRPTGRPTVEAKQTEWLSKLEGGARAVLNGEVTSVQVLELVAMAAAADWAKAIEALHAPALSLLTLALRKWKKDNPGKEVTGKIVGEVAASLHAGPPDLSGISTKPLVETGQMFQALTGVAEKVR